MKETEAYKKYKLRIREKEKSIKKGENVFHLSYYDGLISQNDLIEYEKSIKQIDSEFSSYDKTGDMYACLPDFTLDMYFVLSQITIQGILTNTLNSASWDTIKYILISVWKKIKNKELTKYNSRKSESKPIKFGIKVSIDKNTHFEFNLDGNLSEDLILKSLDKTIDLIKNQKINSDFKHPYFLEYDKKKKKWNKIDPEKEIRKRLKKK